MSSKQQQLKVAGLIKELESNQVPKMTAALQELEKIGNESILPFVSRLLIHSNESVRKLSQNLMAGLQQQELVPFIMDLVIKENNQEIRKAILSSIWNSKLDYSQHLADFVSLATEGDFMQAVECLTVIENLEGPFEENQLLEAQLYLKEFLEGEKGKDSQKDAIISEIALFIKDQNEGIDADLLLD